jgi:hypothetical protein
VSRLLGAWPLLLALVTSVAVHGPVVGEYAIHLPTFLHFDQGSTPLPVIRVIRKCAAVIRKHAENFLLLSLLILAASSWHFIHHLLCLLLAADASAARGINIPRAVFIC